MTEVFISYSRKDKEFVQRLNDALKAIGRNAWVDWEGIPITADWWHEIQRGIEAADTFIFIISRDSVDSKVCRDEVEYAATLNKRLIPVIRNDEFDKSRIHPALSKYNWLFFREQDNFDVTFLTLIKALDMDLSYVQAHTRLLLRSLEWESKGKSSDLVLRGRDHDDADEWLSNSLEKNKIPAPTSVMIDFTEASRSFDTYLKRVEQYNSLKNETLKSYVHSYLEDRKKNLDEDIQRARKYLNESTFLKTSAQLEDLLQEQNVLKNLLGEEGRWHPQKVEDPGITTGAQDDYIDVWLFPCCGKYVRSSHLLSQFRDDGCEEAPKEN